MTATVTAPAPHRDNLLGVCHALGTTFGFDPLIPRVLLMLGLLLDFEAAIATYAVCGIAVLAAALFSRSDRPSAPAGSGTIEASSFR